jgi:predicted cobalt transporter CbtA
METASEKKCTICGERRFVEAENDDGLTVTTEIARKQLRCMPLIPRLKCLFISKDTTRHMKWHKEGVSEKPEVTAHPADTDSWKALDAFDSSFADEVQNVRFGLATDGFLPFNLTTLSTHAGPSLSFPTTF